MFGARHAEGPSRARTVAASLFMASPLLGHAHQAKPRHRGGCIHSLPGVEGRSRPGRSLALRLKLIRRHALRRRGAARSASAPALERAEPALLERELRDEPLDGYGVAGAFSRTSMMMGKTNGCLLAGAPRFTFTSWKAPSW